MNTKVGIDNMDVDAIKRGIAEKKAAALAAAKQAEEEAAREEADLQALVAQSIAYQKKKAIEEARRAKKEEQLKLIEDTMNQSMIPVRDITKKLLVWRERQAALDAYVATEAQAISNEYGQIVDELNQVMDKSALAIGTLDIDHELVHGDNAATAAVDYARRINQLIKFFEPTVDRAATVRLGGSMGSDDIGRTIYLKVRSHLQQKRNRKWLTANFPDWRNIQK